MHGLGHVVVTTTRDVATSTVQVEQGDWKVHFRVIFSKQAASTPDLDPGVHYIMNECYCATVKDGIWVVRVAAERICPNQYRGFPPARHCPCWLFKWHISTAAHCEMGA
jgi:hypothetical protein